MAHVMTRRGNLDNHVTFEHICDSRDDMANISPSEITLGSVCLVLHGTAGLEIYMADSSKEWVSLDVAEDTNTEVID